MNHNSKALLALAGLSLAALLGGCKKPPPTGSCCIPDGSCSITLQNACAGTWTLNGVCSPNPCEQPAPPPPPEIDLETIAKDERVDARVQFAPGITLTEEHVPLGKAIAHLADAIARGDSKKLKPLLTRRAQSLLDDLTTSGGWEEGTAKIEAVRIILVKGGVDFGGVGAAHIPAAEMGASLMAKVMEALAGVPAESLAAISRAATEALAGADPAALAADPSKLTEIQGKLAAAAAAAGVSEEVINKLTAIGADLAPPPADTSSGSGTVIGVLLAVQDIHGAYLLGWGAERVGDGWAFTNAPSMPDIRPRASLWDGIGAEGFQALSLASAPIALPSTEPSGGGSGSGGGGGHDGGGAPPSSPGGERPPPGSPPSPPGRAPGSPGRPPGSG